MMIIAAIGLIANITSAISLFKKGDVDSNLNLKSAYLHVISDAFTSFGVIVSGVLIMAFGWHLADPIMSIITTLIILKGAWGVLNDSIHILMQGTPEGIDPEEIKYELEKLDGVKDVHDLHVWTISSGFDSISCHMLIEDDHDTENILQQSIDKIEKAFGIRHITIQLEKYDYSTI
jgi:cobalt-zinc-cadmium efflux system protein